MSVEILLVLLFLLLLLGGVAVVGHLMWLMLAGLFRVLAGVTQDPNSVSHNDRQRQLEDFLAFRKVLGAFRERNWVTPGTAEMLIQLCHRGEEELVSGVSSRPASSPTRTPVQAPAPQVLASRAAESQPVTAAPVVAAPIPTASVASQTAKPVAEREWVLARLVKDPTIPVAARAATPPKPTVASIAAPPRRAMVEVLRSFLAAHNIRWGELVAGILIVVCSIGLVISLWSTLTATHRLLPAAVFLLAAAGIEGAGLYTLRRWKLRHTSRVVLIIGTMLIPLSMMAGISVAGSGAGAVSLTAPSTWGVIAVGWLVCGGLIFYGGRALVRRPADRWWTLAIGLPTVMLPMVPALARYFEHSAAWLLLVASTAVATAIVVDARPIRPFRPLGPGAVRRLGPGAVRRRFLLAAIAVYALGVLTAMVVMRLGVDRQVLLSLGIGWIPVFAALATSALSIRQSSTTATPRVVAVTVAAIAGVATLTLFPPTLATFDWCALYTSVVILSTVVVSWRLRTALPIVAAPIAIGLFAPLASVHLLGGIPWDDTLPLWRRYVSGESMLSLFAAAALILPISRSRRIVYRWGAVGRQLLGGAGIGLAAAALAIGLMVGLGPAAWLGILPRYVVVALLSSMALAVPLAQPGRRRSVNLATFAAMAAWATALVPLDVWFQQPIGAWLTPLTVAILGSSILVALIGEVTRLAWGKTDANPAAEARAEVLGWWWDRAAGLAVVGVALSAIAFSHDRWVGMLAAAAATAVLLVAAVRSGKSAWFSVGQIASILATTFAAVWFRPAWFLTVSAWTTADALFASVSVLGGFAAVWAGIRVLTAAGPASIARLLERDQIYFDGHVARVGAAGWTVGTVVVLYRIFGGYADWTVPGLPNVLFLRPVMVLPEVAFLISGMIATAAAVGAWWWLSLRADRNRGLQTNGGLQAVGVLAAAEWSLAATITFLTSALILSILACGTGAAGVAGVGWSMSLLASVCAAGFWWWGRGSTDEFRRGLIHQLRVVSVWTALVVGGAAASLVVGMGDLSLLAGTQIDLYRWTLGTLAAWALLGTLVLALLSKLLHSHTAAYLAALLAPATAVVIWQLSNATVVGREWTAVAVATTLLSYLFVRLLSVLGVTARLDAVAWPATETMHQAEPVWRVAMLGIVVTMVVAALQIGVVWSGNAAPFRTVLLWSGSYLLAAGLIIGRASTGMSSVSKGDTGLTLVVLGSGLAAAVGVSQGWIPFDRGWVCIATIWMLATAGFGALGIFKRRQISVAAALALSAAVAIAAADDGSMSQASLLLWAAATALASGLALAAYVRFPWRIAGQWVAAAAAASALWLVANWVPDEYLVTTVGLTMASLALLWRIAGSPPVANCFAAASLLAIGCLMLLVFGEAYGRSIRIEDWAAAMGASSLAMLIATTPLAMRRFGSLSIGYLATHVLVALGVGSLWRDGLLASPLAVAVMACILVSGLWVWGWPLRRRVLRASHRGKIELDGIEWDASTDRRATAELVGMLLLSTAVGLAIASLAVVSGIDANSRWLMIGSVAGFGWLIAVASGWSEPRAAVSAEPAVPAEGRRTLEGGDGLRIVSVLVFTAALLLTAAGLDPETRPWALIVAMRMLVAGVILVPITVWVAPRLMRLDTQQWGLALRCGAAVGGAVAGISLSIMLVLEWHLRNSGEAAAVPLSLVIGIAILLGVWSATTAALGLRPGSAGGVLPTLRDVDRRWLLRAAQVIGGIAWLHVFLCRPELATLGLRPYWPYLVLVLAFLSAAIAEWGRRRGDTVVGDTMRQTTLYLPLIPAIGFWLSAARSEWVFGGGAVSYAWLLLLAAALYGGLAVIWRRDIFPRVASIVLANFALWVVLAQSPNFDFVTHPQLWSIPPAVCVLFAAHLERRRLDAKVLAAIRYSGTLVIYVSSTADVLLGEIGEGLYGPIILILLALAGMAAGAALRTRAFLYLGTLFVVVGVLSMVWHAQQAIDQVWPWWVFGITTGVLLLVGLMAIEKNKPKIRHWADSLAAWDS